MARAGVLVGARGGGGPQVGVVGGLELLLVAVMAAAVGASFSRVFGGAELGVLAVGAAVGGVVLSGWVSGVRGWSPSGALLASMAVGLVVVTVVTWRTAPTPGPLWRTVEAVVAAPSRVLSAPLPAPDRAELLVLVAACTWAVAYAAAELVVRVRGPLLPLVPVVLGTAVPLVLGADGPGASGTVLGCLTVGAGALVLLRTSGLGGRAPVGPGGARRARDQHRAGSGWPGRHPGRQGPEAQEANDGQDTMAPGRVGAGSRAADRVRRRRAAMALPVVVVAGALPLAFRDRLPLSRTEPRFDPRAETRGAPPDVRNPLVEVSVQRNTPENRELFVAETTGDVELWRLAVLDTFDGASWRSSATFAPVGTELPRSVTTAAGGSGDGDDDDEAGRDDEALVTGTPVHQEITLRELDSPFLPVAGRAVELDGPQVRFDPAGGVVLAERAVGEGTTYDVESVVVDPTEEQLDVATRDRRGADTEAAGEPVPEAGLLADVAISEVTNRSAGLTGSADVRQLRALQDFFADQDRFRIATEPRSGLSLRHLTEFVRTAVEGGTSEGSIEQFAAAYAVMARTLGYPTRVVAGYRTVEPDDDGRYHVDSHDAFAWTEVKLEGLGWVPFVAAPIRSQSSPSTEVPTTTTSTTLADDGDLTPTTEASGSGSAPDRGSGSGGRPWWLMAGTVPAAVALLAVVAAPTLRWQRRWRRARHPDVARRIEGAWRELLDRLAAHRIPVTRAMTATEVVSVTSADVGTDIPREALDLAALVNLTRFSPTDQPPAAATAAWRAVDHVTRWVRHHQPRPRRLRAWLNPRTLGP